MEKDYLGKWKKIQKRSERKAAGGLKNPDKQSLFAKFRERRSKKYRAKANSKKRKVERLAGGAKGGESIGLPAWRP